MQRLRVSLSTNLACCLPPCACFAVSLRPFDPNNEDPDADPPIAVVEVEEDDLAKNATLRVVPVHNADSKHNEEDPMSANARSMSVIQPPPHAHHPHGTAHAADDSTLVSKHTH